MPIAIVSLIHLDGDNVKALLPDSFNKESISTPLKFVWKKINYIHNNPVKEGVVKNPEDWCYSSASNYQEMESILEVERLPQRLSKFS